MAANPFKLVRDVDKAKGEFDPLFLQTKTWRAFKPGNPVLNWKKVKFDKANRSNVPKDPGIYAFLVELDHPSLPPHGYLMYVGKTGADQSNNTLHGRFGDYLREMNAVKARPAVQYMLVKWNGDLSFYYAVIAKNRITSIEDKLIAATRPPVNRNYVDARLSPVMQAAFR
jgi:hypothetical protein